MINRRRLIRLTQDLIRINSENPPGDEEKIARFVKKRLDRLGVSTRIYTFKKKRGNIVGILAGRNKKRSLLLTPHLDTVPAGRNWHIPPFSGRIKQDKIYGLGATDCKGNLACALEALQSLVENKVHLDYNLVFAATADEESGSTFGLIPLLDKGILKPDAAVVLDADDFDIIVAQKGLLHMKVLFSGRRAHGAYPWLGKNAIDSAAEIICSLKNLKFSYRVHPYLHPPTLNVGTIRGGDKVNIVADWCELELDFRFLPGMQGEAIIRQVKDVIRRHTRNFKIEVEGIQEPYEIDKNHPLVVCFSSALRMVGVRPRIKGSEGATTITFFQHKNIPAVACGFGSGKSAHMIDEYAKIHNLYLGAKALQEFLKIYKF